MRKSKQITIIIIGCHNPGNIWTLNSLLQTHTHKHEAALSLPSHLPFSCTHTHTLMHTDSRVMRLNWYIYFWQARLLRIWLCVCMRSGRGRERQRRTGTKREAERKRWHIWITRRWNYFIINAFCGIFSALMVWQRQWKLFAELSWLLFHTTEHEIVTIVRSAAQMRSFT